MRLWWQQFLLTFLRTKFSGQAWYPIRRVQLHEDFFSRGQSPLSLPYGSRRLLLPLFARVYNSSPNSVQFISRHVDEAWCQRHDRQDFQQTGLPMSADRSRCSALCEPQLTHTVYLWSHSFAVDSRNAHVFGRGWCTEKFVRSKVLDHIIANVLFRCRSHARYFAAFSLRKFIALKAVYIIRADTSPRALARAYSRVMEMWDKD